MIPTFVPQLTAQATPEGRQPLQQLLPAGQMMLGRVMQLGQATAGNQGFRIQVLVGTRALTLDIPRPIAPGTEIQIRREPGGQISIGLPAATTAKTGVSAPPAAAVAVGSTASAPLDNALRASLPNQQSSGEVLKRLSAMPLPTTTAGQQVGQLIQSLLQHLLIRPGQRDAAAVRRNVELGGFFSEARLAEALKEGLPPAPDLKSRLGQLQRLSEQLPPEAREQMQKLTEALLARVTTQQLSSAQHKPELADGGSERQFRLDLPVLVDGRYETVGLDVRRRRPAPDSDPLQGCWTVRLHFDLDDGLGSLDADIRLGDDGRLSAQFWAAEREAARQVEAGLGALTTTLERQGISVDRLHCRHGVPAAADSGIRRRLIDLRT
ncbi:MAG: flagellar hook-length control protein FliK [Oceanospirillaceae bacterium]|nr:flagellar hook-length control protein FliK [Oceanospirillaceae bacterium]